MVDIYGITSCIIMRNPGEMAKLVPPIATLTETAPQHGEIPCKNVQWNAGFSNSAVNRRFSTPIATAVDSNLLKVVGTNV